MTGMNAQNGRRLDRAEHIRQSVANILSTPLGSLVMHRDYGSVLADLIDAPLNETTLLQAYAATVIAVQRWEDRLTIQRITRVAAANAPGSALLSLDGTTDQGNPLRIDWPTGANA